MAVGLCGSQVFVLEPVEGTGTTPPLMVVQVVDTSRSDCDLLRAVRPLVALQPPGT